MKIHIVKKGDTLYLLAQKYGVTLEKITAANPQITDPNQLEIGMKVKIPSEAVPASPAQDVVYQHKVKQGDTLWQLSKAWGIPLQNMIEANPQLKNPNALLVGETVNIPKVKGEQMTVPSNPKMPGGKTYTGVKEELTQPKEELTAPKEELTKPKEEMPLPPVQQLPVMPEMPVQPTPPPVQEMPQPIVMITPPAPAPLPQPVPAPIMMPPQQEMPCGYEKPKEDCGCGQMPAPIPMPYAMMPDMYSEVGNKMEECGDMGMGIYPGIQPEQVGAANMQPIYSQPLPYMDDCGCHGHKGPTWMPEIQPYMQAPLMAEYHHEGGGYPNGYPVPMPYQPQQSYASPLMMQPPMTSPSMYGPVGAGGDCGCGGAQAPMPYSYQPQAGISHSYEYPVQPIYFNQPGVPQQPSGAYGGIYPPKAGDCGCRETQAVLSTQDANFIIQPDEEVTPSVTIAAEEPKPQTIPRGAAAKAPSKHKQVKISQSDSSSGKAARSKTSGENSKGKAKERVSRSKRNSPWIQG
ncbi:LysM peptidoglycan-binding domain-containing protein [Paenibacillus sp. JX-17]|uniref:LysM peptidoglycan-binding domain-containing protein n=1 Tax=Paenibacillus lacisoli TaxID=3064525 RepID=A0ABT9CGX6_9BACL|nr:LysM peptidoglycan-binding domain-containing protein [Paenibacillus sp. JX-17]MDO7906868.1 LysM peptidoglycan-binding domain-containing protein [Paenibacillus sp. JX-17]